MLLHSIESESVVTMVPIDASSDCVHSMTLLYQGDRDSELGSNEQFVCDEIAQCADVGARKPTASGDTFLLWLALEYFPRFSLHYVKCLDVL